MAPKKKKTPTKTATKTKAPAGVIAPAGGLMGYYSSVATSALAQFDNIYQLIGETHDWTAPGTACEVLIRQLVRNVLPSRYSVDKGFIYGRRTLPSGNSAHSPEIDVLIHDSHEYAPMFRMDDFVIVHAAAVRGIIQVKRTLTSATLSLAIQNLVEAKQHIRDCRSGPIRAHPLENVFSAFVTFRDDVKAPAGGGVSNTYKNRLKKVFREPLDGYVMPTCVGCLSNRIFAFSGVNMNKMGYTSFRCNYEKGDEDPPVHVGLQVLLLMLTWKVLPMGMRPPFSIPKAYESDYKFLVYEATGAEAERAAKVTPPHAPEPDEDQDLAAEDKAQTS